eukprot:scaffold329607_cov76-Cyclotella_meneghiniana.AAC.1
MPGVMNRYIKYESAGDQYVGRCVSGRDRLSKRFAESLPYFDLSDYSGLEREQKLRQLDRWIKDRMPAVASANDAVFYLFKMCLASLIHHREWLNETLHSESPVRMTSFWYEDIPLADHVTTKFPWTRTNDTPEFTGIPIDVLYMAKVEEQNAIIARLEERLQSAEERLLQDNNRVVAEVTEHMDKALDERAVGGESFSMGRDIIKKLDTLINISKQDYVHRVDNATNNGDDDEDDDNNNNGDDDDDDYYG